MARPRQTWRACDIAGLRYGWPGFEPQGEPPAASSPLACRSPGLYRHRPPVPQDRVPNYRIPEFRIPEFLASRGSPTAIPRLQIDGRVAASDIRIGEECPILNGHRVLQDLPLLQDSRMVSCGICDDVSRPARPMRITVAAPGLAAGSRPSPARSNDRAGVAVPLPIGAMGAACDRDGCPPPARFSAAESGPLRPPGRASSGEGVGLSRIRAPSDLTEASDRQEIAPYSKG